MIGSTRYASRAQIAAQQRLAAEMNRLQTSISTGKRIAVGSEDVTAAARVAEIRQTQADHLVWSRNADTGAATAATADTALGSLGSMLDRAKDLTLQGRNDSSSAADRALLATELRGLADDMDQQKLAVDPQGRQLFPSTDPIRLPVGNGVDLPATASRAAVFEGVATADGPRGLSDVLRRAADALTAGDAGIARLDTTGAPAVDADGNPVMMTRGDAITASIDALDAAVGHITAQRTDQGLRGQRLDDAKAALAASDTDLATERSGLEDTDLTYAYGEFSANDLALKAAQALFTQTHKRSLFDLLG